MQISPGMTHPPSRLCLSDLRRSVPCKYWALVIMATSPRYAASHPLPVRQASALPSASFRFAVARDTLAVRLTLPLAGRVEDFHLRVSAPCRAHHKKRASDGPLPFDGSLTAPTALPSTRRVPSCIRSNLSPIVDDRRQQVQMPLRVRQPVERAAPDGRVEPTCNGWSDGRQRRGQRSCGGVLGFATLIRVAAR
jgi:hypothetical protein